MIFRGKFWFLSNMYSHNITYKGHTYACAESAFQAQKDATQAFQFEKLDGFAAKKLGKRVNLRPDWDQVKLQIMKEILKVKFSDHDLMNQLKAVTEPIVEENTWRNTYWGVCNGYGQNHLGKLLTEIKNNY